MRLPIRTSSLALVLLLGAPALGGGLATFEFIPGALSADDMSPDGRYIVGSLIGGGTYLLDSVLDVMTVLPPPAYQAVGVSDNGSAVVGNIIDPKTGDDLAAIWTSATNAWTSLGSFQSGSACPSRSSAYEISNDGTVVVGLAWINGCSAVGFRWTEATGMVQLEQLVNGGNRASVVNSNGSLIGGFAQGSFSRTPTIWTDRGGVVLDPPNGDALGEIHGMNDSGTILLGTWNGAATMWTSDATVRTTIGQGAILPGWEGIPMDIAPSGTVVGFDFLFGNRRAWIQPNGDGPLLDLKAFIEANGAVVPQNFGLQVCQAISVDGRKIVGHGGFEGAWTVTVDLPTPCSGDLSPAGGDGIVDGADLGVLLNAWGTAVGDLNGDGITDGADLGILLNQWGACSQSIGACCLNGACSQVSAGECAALGGDFLGALVPCTLLACTNNDLCADAIDITTLINGPPIFADNSLATPPFGGGDPELPKGSPSCQWAGEPQAAHSTIWYRFVAPPNSIAMAISICDPQGTVTVNDTVMALYTGTCGNLVEAACNDDGCDANFLLSDLELIIVEPGVTYYLCIMNPGSWTGSTPGSFSFTITEF